MTANADRAGGLPREQGRGDAPRDLDAVVDLTVARQLLNAQMDEIGRLSERVTECSRQLDHFAHVASHDLKAPLRRVTLYMSRLQDQLGDELAPDAAESMAAVERAVNRMRSLIDDLLDYSRVANAPLEIEAVDPTACVQEALEDLGPQIDSSGCRVEVGPLPHVQADPVRLRQLLQNLIANSIQYRSDAPPLVRIWGEAVNGDVRLHVADNGIGMAPEHHARVFELFSRLRPASDTDGNGAGLAICKRIAERHGGTIRVASDAGKGATFTIVLPRREAR